MKSSMVMMVKVLIKDRWVILFLIVVCELMVNRLGLESWSWVLVRFMLLVLVVNWVWMVLIVVFWLLVLELSVCVWISSMVCLLLCEV